MLCHSYALKFIFDDDLQVHTSEESDEQGEVFDDPAEEMDVPTVYGRI